LDCLKKKGGGVAELAIGYWRSCGLECCFSGADSASVTGEFAFLTHAGPWFPFFVFVSNIDGIEFLCFWEFQLGFGTLSLSLFLFVFLVTLGSIKFFFFGGGDYFSLYFSYILQLPN
jgi:hypothetical protein